jgi:hypothetical protein
MNLQSKYRLERDNISTVETDEYFFAFQMTENEFHVLEVYIRDDLRGNSEIYYKKITDFIKQFKNIKHIVGFIIPRIKGSERSMMAMLKFGFKIHSCNEEKITLIKEVV